VKVAVIGAGPAGMSAAYCLSKEGVNVDVYEASPQVGGLSKTLDLWNQKVDLGPHRFFSDDTRVNKLWLEVAGQDYDMVDRLTRIYYKKKFFFYPLKPFNALSNLGVVEAASCFLSYVRERISPTTLDGSFENWVVSRFGRRLFEIFFKTYSEKLWGISCKELDSDFAAQRIKKLSMFEAIKNALFAGKKNKHKTLIDQFAYPLHGTGMIYENMRKAVEKKGGNVYCSSPVQRVLAYNGTVTGIELPDGTVKEYDHVISTMPLSLLVTRLPEVPAEIKEAAESLRFRNTILVYLNVDGTDLFPDNWLYIHSTDLQSGRITNFRNWVPQLYGNEKTSILVLEYWCYNEDALWKASDAELIELGKKELIKTGLIKNSPILDGYVHKIPRCYPVYERGYKERLKPIENYLSGIGGLSVIGRYGAFKYNNQDHSMLMGIMAADNILKKGRHNLWDINTDYETYQEASVITKTGLQKV
jgi:protoporphyrinogen oxidase